MTALVEIAGSAPASLPHYAVGAPVPPDLVLEARLELRPAQPLPPLSELCRGSRAPLTPAAFAERYGMRAADLVLAESVLRPFGLEILADGRTCWSIRVRGPAAAFAAAFGVELRLHEGPDGRSHPARTGPVHLPARLAGIVRAVTGLDRRPTPRPDALHADMGAPPPVLALTPQGWAEHYEFPQADCTSQTVALLEFPASYAQDLLQQAFANLAVAMPQIDGYTVDGGTIDPNAPKLGETGLDLVIAGVLAPGARLALVGGVNLYEDMGVALYEAVHAGGAQLVSISYGAPETVPPGSSLPGAWPSMNLAATELYFAMAALLGVTVCVASGDDGSTAGCDDPDKADSPYVLGFPSSCPLVLSCGGTQIATAQGGAAVEEVWNFPAIGARKPGAPHLMIGGGGVSLVFDLPPFQDGIGVPAYPGTGFQGRGSPDLAVAAAFYDFGPGVGLYLGTSAASPFVAALMARLNAALGQPLGLVAPQLYALFARQAAGDAAVFADIVAGSNAPPGHDLFPAQTGWDPASGMGTPIGRALLSALQLGPAAKVPAA